MAGVGVVAGSVDAEPAAVTQEGSELFDVLAGEAHLRPEGQADEDLVEILDE